VSGAFVGLVLLALGALASVLLLGLLVLLGVAWIARVRNDRREARRRAIRRERAQHEEQLRQLGFAPSGDGSWTGELDGVEVVWFCRLEGDVPALVHRWSVSAPAGSLTLRPRGTLSAGRDLEVGDSRFDRRFLLRGSQADLALLTTPVREALLSLPDVTLAHGQLACSWGRFDLQDVHRLLALARALREQPPETAARLQQRAADPVASVRLRALLEATACDPALAARLAVGLRGDEDPSVRALCAAVLRDEGFADALSAPEVRAEVRAWATEAMLRSGSPAQRLAAGQALVREPWPLRREQGVALLRGAGPLAERGLIEALSEADAELLEPILLALREVAPPGSVAAVPALRARQARLSLLQEGLSQAIERTILSLQEQSGGVKGGLAVAGAPDAQGALAVAGGPGRLAQARQTER
jgi:hypothetical protein